MARNGATNDIVFYGAIGFGSYLTYHLALNGSLGPSAQRSALDIQAALQGKPKGTTGTPTSPAGGSSAAVPTSQYSPALQRMVAANPNFISQATEWRGERRANGEDPNSWMAFQAHEVGINAPDPGQSPPAEWPNSPLFGGPLSSPVTNTAPYT